mmetsp:Transcript_33727/g.67199  ORF Transcript_33727/g.67199 Transcript_33727/m.67199 type:complete len:264 (-) Transcript_33727:347-1138(-)
MVASHKDQKSNLREIDLATGKFKEVKPLKDALDYKKWDQVATRVNNHGGEDEDGDEVSEYFWVELPHNEIRVRIPVLGKTTSKQCKIDIKRNWLKVFAPPPESVVGSNPPDAPPKEALLDFQLHGAVDPEECHWELVDDGAIRNIILTLQKSPVYDWPTLHRVNGLKREEDRAKVRERERKQWEEESRREAEAQKNQATTDYGAAAGPQRPPKYGPAPAPKRRPHRPKDEEGKPLPPVGRPPGVYERGRIIVTEPEFTDSDED